jgi:NADH-quinone oxidoreductase subunit J
MVLVPGEDLRRRFRLIMGPLDFSSAAIGPAVGNMLEVSSPLVARQHPAYGGMDPVAKGHRLTLLQPGIFYGLAGALLAFVLVVVCARSVFHSALALTAALSVVAGLFAFLGADFVAAGQLLVYVGGIMTIMLFVIMLSHSAGEGAEDQTDSWPSGLALGALIAGLLLRAFQKSFSGVSSAAEALPTSARIGRLLLGDMLVPFEVVSLILLAALVGTVLYGRKPEDEE